MHRWLLAAAALAGLAGACGISLAAAAAHLAQDPRLQTAATFMLAHATATLAVCALAFAQPAGARWFLGAAAAFLLGSLLFGGDLALRSLAGAKLFPMAAPLGGILLILGWALVMPASVIALRAVRQTMLKN